ncbi:ferredoxin family protein [Fibrobacter sp. UWB11]|uniref:4Fe-4S dicluster domain-containing protein n=1 Tax=Fibrobacter sp. UWB11 TaxID=1896202 RepID=UPI000925EFA7|nr:ferredoxin family protein [Fibrobacter sp. UWB11]SIN95609.1 dissimilatory adenylylsulfate reductase beta subunit [Fibrobacter sp. UWB11]
MSINIDPNICIGCGRCHDVCPGTLIKINELKKAYIKYPKDCWGCTSCIKECPVHAIRFFLGEDIGGKGSKVHTEKVNGLIRWIVEFPDGSVKHIVIDPKESNKY